MNTSAFTLYLLPFVVKKTLQRRWRTSLERPRYVDLCPSILKRPLRSPFPSSPEYQPLSTQEQPSEDAIIKPRSSDTELPPLTSRETAHLAAVFCIFWFIANWTVNSSLEFTSVASATILSSTSGTNPLCPSVRIRATHWICHRLLHAGNWPSISSRETDWYQNRYRAYQVSVPCPSSLAQVPEQILTLPQLYRSRSRLLLRFDKQTRSSFR